MQQRRELFRTTYTYLVFRMAPMVMFCVIITHLVVHFEFLYDSEIICLPLNIIEKLYWQHLFEKLGEAETIITFISVNTLQHLLILKNNIDYSSKMEPPLFFHSDINLYFATFWSILSTCSGCNGGIDLVAVLEYTFVPLCAHAEQIS